MPKLVIGVIGKNGSGKDQVVNFLEENYDIPALSIGDIVREIAKDEGKSQDRESLHEISIDRITEYGKTYFAKMVVDKIEASDWLAVAVTGIRTPDDVDVFEKRYDEYFILAHVEITDPEIRFNRLKERGAERDPKTYEEFKKQDKAEEKEFNISEAMKRADIKLNNDGSLQNFHKSIMKHLVFRDIFKKVVGDERVGIE